MTWALWPGRAIEPFCRVGRLIPDGRLQGFHLRSSTSKLQGLRSAAAFTPYLCVYAGIAFAFYWLMQPTVVPNQGLAAYKPPPLAVVNYASSPFVPPPPSEPPPVLAAGPAAETVAAAPEMSVAPAAEKKATRKREARANPRHERTANERTARSAPSWNYAFGASNGFRPWF